MYNWPLSHVLNYNDTSGYFTTQQLAVENIIIGSGKPE